MVIYVAGVELKIRKHVLQQDRDKMADEGSFREELGCWRLQQSRSLEPLGTSTDCVRFVVGRECRCPNNRFKLLKHPLSQQEVEQER